MSLDAAMRQNGGIMKITIDRAAVADWQNLPDDKLWHKICVLTSGLRDLDRRRCDGRRMRRIRALLDALTDSDLARINALIECWQSEK